MIGVPAYDLRTRCVGPNVSRVIINLLSSDLNRKGMLHQGLKVKKLNDFQNFKSALSELCRISL